MTHVIVGIEGRHMLRVRRIIQVGPKPDGLPHFQRARVIS